MRGGVSRSFIPQSYQSVEPACAWWGEDTAYGGVVGGATGGFWGGAIFAVIAVSSVIATGGLAALPMAGAAIGGAALTGATYGAAGGATVGAAIGATTDKETVDQCATAVNDFGKSVVKDHAVNVGLTLLGVGVGSLAAQGQRNSN